MSITIKNCRICNSNELLDIVELKEQYITSRFPKYRDWTTSKVSITLCKCSICGLVQLKQSTIPSELYEHEYGYRSGISNTMKLHLNEYVKEILSKVELSENDVVVDIGSNDSTMLQYYSNKLKRIGVDPTGTQFIEYYNDIGLIPTYFTYENFNQVYPTLKCKIVSSVSMFYDLPDPVKFAKDVYNILDDDGIWTCEQSYLCTMIKTNSIDTICHEHLEYYALHQIKEIADRANFKIIDVKFNNCNGGSFRVYFSKKQSTKYEEATELINKILNEEIKLGIFENKLYENFISQCDFEVNKLKNFIDTINNDNKEIWIYGASTKGNCLLQYANLTENDLKYAVERNPKKIGKMTCSGSQIISEETMRLSPPEFLLVLPWHFKNEIIQRENEYLERGGQLVFPFPNFEIISKKPKLLITGSNGMIAKYVKDVFTKDYTLYGISKTNINLQEKDKNITTFYFDINQINILEQSILTIQPYTIIHLASISSSKIAYENSLLTIQTNGMITANLCDIIYRNNLNTKLFNSSSSEMYKGHVVYNVKEDDHNMFHVHPYSISKILAHNCIQYYRQKYNLPFSNGVFFTIESPYKKPEFLLNKIKTHAKKWIETKEPINTGILDSFRNILHAEDAAKAIKIIIEKDYGDDYLICNNESMKVYDMVKHIYNNFGIYIEKKDNIIVDTKTNLPVAYIENINKGYDTETTNITGKAIKLEKLGWKPNYSIIDILNE
jgi:GDP-mannose 4,6-dehydratase